MTEEVFQQYCVLVPGRGFIGSPSLAEIGQGIALRDHVDDVEPFRDVSYGSDGARPEADKMVDRVKQWYVNMRCPEIAETVCLISRTETWTFDEWGPV